MSSVDRVVVGTPATPQVVFNEDGVPVDPGTVTVGATRLDGSVVITAGTATSGTGAAARSVPLTTAHTALLDTIRLTWTSSDKGTLTSTVEIVGGFVFAISDVRATSWGAAANNDATYRISTASIVAARIEVERALEHELGFAMVPRFSLETVDGDGGSVFLLSNPYPRVVRSASVAGVVLTVPQVATVVMSPTGRVYYPGGWTSGYGNVVVGYEHGLSVPPPGATQVALALAKRALTGAPADDRATSMSTDEQTTTFYVPGGSEPFDVPAANRFVSSYTLRTGIA